MMKLIAKLAEWILGTAISDDEPRADMFLPVRALAIAIVFLVAGAGCGAYSVVGGAVWIGAAAALIILGIALFLCWKNQKIIIRDEETFEYYTFLGNQKVYRFDQIEGFRRNRDSTTIFVAGEKVHIESMALMTQRLEDMLNAELTKHV